MTKASTLFVKNIISPLISITRSKSLALKSKIEAMKAKFIIFSLLKNKKLPITLKTRSISHKIHALLIGSSSSQEDNDHEVMQAVEFDDHDENRVVDDCKYCYIDDYDVDDDNKYPDLRHCLFDEEDLSNPNASVIDLVKNSMENDGEDFSLEDEIDNVADLFIKKFHKRMRLQKLESFKRYQDMLERSS